MPPEVLGKIASHFTKKRQQSVFSADACAYSEVEMKNVLAELQPVTDKIRRVTTVLNQQLKDRNQFNSWNQQTQTPNILFSEWPRTWTGVDLVPQLSINHDLVDGLRDGLRRDGGIVCSWTKETSLSNKIHIPLHTSQACTYTMYVEEYHSVSDYDKSYEDRWLEFRMTYTDCTECVVRIKMEEDDVYSQEYSLSIFLGPQVQKTSPGHADAVRLWKSRTRDVAAFVASILRAQQEPYLLLHLTSPFQVAPSIKHMCLDICGQYGLTHRIEG